MFVRNTDTGRWSNQIDSLSKDNYDNLRQDLEKTRLYSKCLSGSTYLPINSFQNIYDSFDVNKIGFYVSQPPFSAINYPFFGPQLSINSSNYNEFYNKYLKENAFTIKNLFTPNKLIKDQLENYLTVDVATTGPIEDLGQTNTNYTIDTIRLREGQRILVKDQVSRVTLDPSVDPEVYFTTTEMVSEYFIDSSELNQTSYFWYNQENGIYLYTDNKLLKTADLDTYDDVYRYSVFVKLGDINREKQFHLARLKNGYYPVSIEGDNMQFVEKKNWVLRNRVDYNNIFDLNYYDIIQHSTQSVYVELDSRTYSIPPRTIVVGEFGVIINNQDKLSDSATFSQSSIISNKFKVNLRSIVEVDNYYWCCGDEGTLLKISKHNFNIQRIELDEISNFKSVSFFGNLYGKVVGDFNSIWWTKDGGLKWNKLVIPEFDGYSYNKVIYYNLNKTYVAGDVGVFIEFDYINGTWLSYKRKVAKQLNALDEYILIEDINDMFKTDWVRMIPMNYVEDSSSLDFADSLVYINTENNSFVTNPQIYRLNIELNSPYFGLSSFSQSQFYGAIVVTDGDGNTLNPGTGANFGIIPSFTPINPPVTSWDFYYSPSPTTEFKNTFTAFLPIQSDGKIKETTFTVRVQLWYNYDGVNNQPSNTFSFAEHTYQVETRNGNLLLLAGNNSTIICYDINSLITNSQNQFIYFTPTQSFSDVRSISMSPENTRAWLTGDKIYTFNTGVFTQNGTVSNIATGGTIIFGDKFVNKIILNKTTFRPYIVGNNSLNQFNISGTSSFFDLDPTFNSKIKSKFLFLDYDIASKLNFFTDEGEYRLPSPVSFSQSSFTQSFVVSNISGEKNWISYYKDAEKTFRYYSTISDTDRVEFSTTFSNYPRTPAYIHTIPSNLITTSLREILPLAPTLISPTFSRFIDQQPALPDIAGQYSTNFRILLYRHLLIFKITLTARELNVGAGPNIGDVLRIESDVVDCNLVINRIEGYRFNPSLASPPRIRMTNYPTGLTLRESADIYCYCYSEFNGNILKNLQKPGTQVYIKNLNKYTNVSGLLDSFELHPVSIGYKLESNGSDLVLSTRFNNKTAYYNLAATATIGSISKNLVYLDSFLNFGYTPTYNLLDYLQRIDSNRFLPGYKFTILPEFYGVPGNYIYSFTNSNVFIDLQEGTVSGLTNSYYRTGTNEIIFGENLKFYWNALLLHTFIDLTLNFDTGSFTTEKLLIIDKYYDSNLDGWVMKFHKKIQPLGNNYNVISFNFVTRNTLGQISEDLQTLNNIQRSSITKSVQNLENFTNLQSELISKFPTESYFKALVSDYNIREYISGIIYTDSDFELAMNLLRVEERKNYPIIHTTNITTPTANNRLLLLLGSVHELREGDLVEISFNAGAGSSEVINPQYFGLHTVIESLSSPGYNYVIMSLNYGVGTSVMDTGTISIIKKDPFFNYIPVDLFDLDTDKRVSRAIEVRPENYILVGNKYNLENLDLNKFRYKLIDGLSLAELSTKFGWILEAEISNAIIGKDKEENLVWYKGTWFCGRWFGGTWYSGRWVSGDWYRGNWYAFNTIERVTTVLVDNSYVDNTVSRWFNGRWFEGDWFGGTWYNGRRYSGNWNTGLWYDGIWNDGTWNDGIFEGGVWVLGTWNNGVFNCNSNPAYFLDGLFRAGDFENGIWYNGQFGNEKGRLVRFGTKSSNSRTSLWHAGRWIDGEFHSFLNVDSSTGLPQISEIHKYSIWRTGVWLRGNFYGGIAYNIDFKAGNWHGGILEEIQVIGVDPILPATASTNSITLNGIFKFNPGDSIWIIDDYRAGAFSPLGSNDEPKKYRINQILEDPENQQTRLYLNFNLSILGVNTTIATQSYSNVETGLRVVSYFKDSYWKSGIWTNGIFDGGQFDSGIWYNGVFDGNWGN